MALVRLITTYKCNLNCFYCHKEGFKEKIELNPNYISYLTDTIKRAGVNRVTLTGGEPTLYNNLDELITTLYKNGINVGITTNGTYIKPNLNKKVICDRYILSTVAYHSALTKFYRCCEEEIKEIINLIDSKLMNEYIILPDITIYLEVDHKEIVNRIKQRITYNKTDKLIQSNEFYNLLKKEYELNLPKYSKKVNIIKNNSLDSLEKILDIIANVR